MDHKKILVTSALPYANGPLHFGHVAGAYLPGDVYARYQRLRGNDVLYICGSDEYGVAITLSAELAGRTPKEHVDIFHNVIKGLFEQLNFSFDHYSRTTWEGHVAPAQQFFLDLIANGYVEDKVTDQLYSETDGRFLADRYVTGTCPSCGYEKARGDECPRCGAAYEATDLKSPRSKVTGAPLTLKSTRHWFLLLDKFKDRLLEWLETKNWKPNVISFVKDYVEHLRPRAITRDSSWGVPVPLEGAEGKVLYVWFDAPIGYISSTMEWSQQQGKPDRWKDYWCDPDTKLVHFIGKDNIPFHTVIFPAMVMGQNQPIILVDEVPANEFFNLEGRKFSKSEGWYVDMEEFFQNYTADQIRYTIAANAPETSDAEFTWRDFQMRCNTELLGKLGNLINRTMVFAGKQCDAKVPPQGHLEADDKAFLEEVRRLVDEVAANYEGFHLRRASQTLMELAQAGNVYFNAKAPWKDAKADEMRPRMATTIACCLECVKAIALVAAPIIPETAEMIWQMLGFEAPLSQQQWDEVIATPLPSGQQLAKPTILFKKVEDKEIDAQIEKLKSLGLR